MEDASLDDFLDSGSEEAREADDADEPEPAESAGDDTPTMAEDYPDADEQEPDEEVIGDGEQDEGQAVEDGPETDEEAANETDEGAGGDTDESVVVTPGEVEPATTTYAWSSGGSACEECGTVVERRWQDDGLLVCPDCKEW